MMETICLDFRDDMNEDFDEGNKVLWLACAS